MGIIWGDLKWGCMWGYTCAVVSARGENKSGLSSLLLLLCAKEENKDTLIKKVVMSAREMNPEHYIGVGSGMTEGDTEEPSSVCR